MWPWILLHCAQYFVVTAPTLPDTQPVNVYMENMYVFQKVTTDQLWLLFCNNEISNLKCSKVLYLW